MLMLILRQITGIVYLIVLKTYYNLSQILQQKLAYQDAQLSPVFSVKFKILDVWVHAFLPILLILIKEDVFYTVITIHNSN